MTKKLNPIEMEKNSSSPYAKDLQKIFEAWIDELQHNENRSPKTLSAYARDLSQFLSFMKTSLGRPPRLEDLKKSELRIFRGFMAHR
ncbi:MAG: site-specific integrase, partial [Hyphomicrobium sp.]